MGLIIKRLLVSGDKSQIEKFVLFDNGASYSLIRSDVAEEIATIIDIGIYREFGLSDGETIISTNKVAIIKIEVDGKVIDDEFYVLDKLCQEVIVGASTMQKWDIVIEQKDEKVIVRKDPKRLEFFKFI